MHEYPLVPLKNIVVFPKTRVSLSISRPRSVRAAQDAERTGRVFVAVAQRHSEVDEASPDDIFAVGTLVEIVTLQAQGDGSVQVLVEGVRRVQVQQWLQQEPYPRIVATRIPEPAPTGKAAESLVRHAHELFDRYTHLNRRFSAEEIASVAGLRSPSRLADMLATHLVDDAKRQQELLETIEPDQRLEKVCVILGNTIEVLELDQRIRQRVRDQVDRNQQEYYLKEQLRAIQKELGNDLAGEMQEMRDHVATLGMPSDIAAKVLREIDKLERLPSNSAEIGVLRNYIEWLIAMPWKERTTDQLDTALAERILNEEHFGLQRVKERIIEFLAVRQLRASQTLRHSAVADEAAQQAANISLVARTAANRGPILCLIGPPGVGKTSLGASIAHAMGRKFVRISLGGVHDEAEIRGHRRTYIGALPGRIIQAMKSVGVRNPIFLLDEIDKLASDYRGDPSAALLEVLDPEQNFTFTDHYLEVPFDLSEVFFICTGNSKYSIPRALADRMDIIDISGYTEDEKVNIARQHLWPKVQRENGLDPDQARIPESVLRFVITAYTREAGVRSLERQLGAVCRKIARRIVRNPDVHVRLTRRTVEAYLGIPRFTEDRALEGDQVGVAMGLAWTESGGTLLPVEVAVMPGRGNVQLTGQQGDVMQESARTALSYIRTRAESLGISPLFADQLDMHIHLPEGAIPKDGPSAGITIGIAMISALTDRPVRSDTAMTGEITLRGRVLGIGGLRDKVLAAHRAGLRRIVLPAENRKDVTEIPERVRTVMEFVYTSSMEDVERAMLRAPVADEAGERAGPDIAAFVGRRDEAAASGADSLPPPDQPPAPDAPPSL